MHPPEGAAWLVWLETSAFAVAMRQWMWLYPVAEIVHILGFVVLVGAAFMFDARLLGASRLIPVTGMERHLLRWARWSLVLVVPTGVSMFVAHAAEMATSGVFQLKLGLVALAGINAAIFHRVPFRSVGAWDVQAPAPPLARVSAVASLVLWTAVIACGRLLAYF